MTRWVSIVDLDNSIVSKVMQVKLPFSMASSMINCAPFDTMKYCWKIGAIPLTVTIIWYKKRVKLGELISVLSKLIPSSIIDESTESKSNNANGSGFNLVTVNDITSGSQWRKWYFGSYGLNEPVSSTMHLESFLVTV